MEFVADKISHLMLQNAIVDACYAQKDWCAGQNYVSETGPNYLELVHFVWPRPEDVGPLMDGCAWWLVLNRTVSMRSVRLR